MSFSEQSTPIYHHHKFFTAKRKFVAESHTNTDVAHSVARSESVHDSVHRTGNRFKRTVQCIAQKMGYDAQHITSMFQSYSSPDFIFGPHSVTKLTAIPRNIWRSLHDHYNLSQQRPFHRQNIKNRPSIFKEKAEVFIAMKVTERLIKNQLILEKFATPKRLYQYLYWTLRMCKVAHCMTLMEGRNGQKVLLFDVELHNQRGAKLYALCIPNDVVTHKSQRWQLADLLTASQITKMLGIRTNDLPRGVREASSQFARHHYVTDLSDIKATLCDLDSRRKPKRYIHLKCIKTEKSKMNQNELKVKLSVIHQSIRRALRSNDVDLIPIVSVVSRKRRKQKQKLEDFRYFITSDHMNLINFVHILNLLIL